MKPAPKLKRVYDLAAMRGWHTIRHDRSVTVGLQRAPSFIPAKRFLPKAA